MEAATEPLGGSDRPPGVWLRAWIPVVVLIVLTVAAALAQGEAADIIGPLGVMIGQGTAGYLLLRNSRGFKGRERLAWRLAGSGFSVAAVGVLVVATIGIINGSAPAFGPTDLIFIASYLLILSGFASLPHIANTTMQRTRVFLDGLIGAVSLAAILGVLFLVDLLSQLEGAPFWERLVASTYPVLDVVMLIMLLWVAVRRSSYRFDPRLLAFGIALAIQAGADMTFFATGIGKTFEEAAPAYGLYVLATVGYATAGVILHRAPQLREYAERGTPLWALAMPYGMAAALAGVVVYSEVTAPDASTTQFLLAAVAAVVALIILRQWIEITENRRYIERQREALVASVSHELRTPLTAVVGVLDIVIEDDLMDTEERNELLEMARKESVYMSRIVKDLILLARDDVNNLTVDRETLNLGNLVRNVVASVNQGGGQTSVDVPGDLVVSVDPDRIKQVITNLLANSIKYGGPNRKVVARRSGDEFVLEVHDDGQGVPKRFELMIWERFERGPHRLDATQPGSGIGLAIVKAIAEAHGGSARYRRSDLLGGACFVIEAPIGEIAPSGLEAA